MSPGPVLESARVRLVPVGPERAAALLAGRPEAGLAWAPGFPLPPFLEFLRRVIGEPDGPVRLGPFSAYVVVRRSDGLAVGDVGFHGPPGPDGEVQIGYALVPCARGAGLAGESVELLVAWALTQPGVRVVFARVAPGNLASVRVLERLGFLADGRSDDYLRFQRSATA